MPSAPESQATHADVLLQETQNMLAPLARMLVAHGVTYPQLAQALKPVFLEAAKAELAEAEKAQTDSALSLLSGVHRKDVRLMRHGSSRSSSTGSRSPSLIAEIVARWATDRKYLNASGKPRSLPVRSLRVRERSFETLVKSVSQDFHPHSVLNELVRLGTVNVRNGQVRLKYDIAPREGFGESAYYLGVNVRDHLSAAVANMRLVGSPEKTPHLEFAVTADEITPESAYKLEQLARKLWSSAAKQWWKKALLAYEADKAKPASSRTGRTRFGAYSFVESLDNAIAEQTRSVRKGQK
jgi:Family of unknown function (DUF6502)